VGKEFGKYFRRGITTAFRELRRVEDTKGANHERNEKHEKEMTKKATD
jgi:hypothetical protein